MTNTRGNRTKKAARKSSTESLVVSEEVSSELKDVVEPLVLQKLLNDPSADLSSLEGKDCQKAMLLMQQVIVGMLQNLVASNEASKLRIDQYEGQVVELKREIVRRDVDNANLKSRLVKVEQYSRRNTMILTGVPFELGEDIEQKTIDIINDHGSLSHVITSGDICNVHRNKPGSAGKPASVTVVFVRGIDKDLLFRGKRDFRTSCEKSLNIFHAMCPELVEEMKNIRQRGGDMIEYIDFYGHSKMFVVKVKGLKDMVRGVQSFIDLEAKVGSLDKLPHYINDNSQDFIIPFKVVEPPMSFSVHPSRDPTTSSPAPLYNPTNAPVNALPTSDGYQAPASEHESDGYQ